jgi:hypothetical protein
MITGNGAAGLDSGIIPSTSNGLSGLTPPVTRLTADSSFWAAASC